MRFQVGNYQVVLKWESMLPVFSTFFQRRVAYGTGDAAFTRLDAGLQVRFPRWLPTDLRAVQVRRPTRLAFDFDVSLLYHCRCTTRYHLPLFGETFSEHRPLLSCRCAACWFDALCGDRHLLP